MESLKESRKTISAWCVGCASKREKKIKPRFAMYANRIELNDSLRVYTRRYAHNIILYCIVMRSTPRRANAWTRGRPRSFGENVCRFFYFICYYYYLFLFIYYSVPSGTESNIVERRRRRGEENDHYGTNTRRDRLWRPQIKRRNAITQLLL